MDFLEDMVFQKYQAVHIDASFPAESMYLKRGYRIKLMRRLRQRAGIISVTIQWKRWQVERDKDFREGTDG